MTKNSWYWVHGPHQESDQEFGFYVIKFITQFYDCMNMHNVSPTMVCLSKLKNLSFKIYMSIISYLHPSLWVCWLQVTFDNFSNDEAIEICCTLVEAIKETIEASIIGCTKWVINLEEPTWRTQVQTQLSLELFEQTQKVCILRKWIEYKILKCSSNPLDMAGQLLFYFLQVGRRFKP